MDPFNPERFDPQVVLVRGLNRGVGHLVSTGRDAVYDPSETVTVIHVSSCTPAGDLTGVRTVFEISFTASTTGADADSVLLAGWEVADQIVNLSEEDGVGFAGVKAVQEPSLVAPHNPSGAQMCTSTWRALVRRMKG